MSRALQLDASLVETGKGKRAEDPDDDSMVVWTYLVPRDRLPASGDLANVIGALRAQDFLWLPEGRQYRVYPAVVGREEASYSDEGSAVEHLAARGGGILLFGFGARIGLVADPQAVARSGMIKRARLADVIGFGEYSVWMPGPEECGEETSTLVEQRVVDSTRALEALLSPTFGYSLWTDEMASIMKRWSAHREVASGHAPSELFWYQYYGRDIAATVQVEEYQRLGFRADRRPNGDLAVLIDPRPSAARPMVKALRTLWCHRVTPIEID